MSITILNRVVGESLAENVTCEQGPKGTGKPAGGLPGREASSAQVGMWPACGKEATVAGACVLAAGGRISKVGWLIMKALWGKDRDSGFTQSVMGRQRFSNRGTA